MEKQGSASGSGETGDLALTPAVTKDHFDSFGRLIRDYVDWLRQRLGADAWFMEEVLSHQSLDRELETLAARYSPPDGRAFLARRGDTVCGAGAYHRFDDRSCEMKRLFVSPAFHGQGIGRKLAGELISQATVDGYDLMRLDTARHLREAIGMYESLGFRRCPPYQIYPPELLPHLVFMERPLAGG